MHSNSDLRRAVDPDWLEALLARCDWPKYNERERLFLYMCLVYVFLIRQPASIGASPLLRKSSYRRIAAYLLMEAKVSQHKLNTYPLGVAI